MVLLQRREVALDKGRALAEEIQALNLGISALTAVMHGASERGIYLDTEDMKLYRTHDLDEVVDIAELAPEEEA